MRVAVNDVADPAEADAVAARIGGTAFQGQRRARSGLS
jgi:hypothetical protein